MRGNLEAFTRWAPDGAAWTPWAKPVMFANMAESAVSGTMEALVPSWISRVEPKTAIIVDLPGQGGVAEGLALARLGYRPVPLYNGTRPKNSVSMLVPAEELEDALRVGARELARLPLQANAPPAFLLDSNRMDGSASQHGWYDNRWCVLPQDMPSASFMLGQGIDTIIVRADKVANDLKHVLHRYVERGIKIALHDGVAPKDVTRLVKPERFRSLFYRLGVLLGLRRNSVGGFGAIIPLPSESGGRSRGRFG